MEKEEIPLGLLTNAVNCWILDYYCQSALQEWAQKFELYTNKYVRVANFLGDFSAELIVNKDLQFKLELISWLPRLHDLITQQKTEEFTEIFKEINTALNVCPKSLTKVTKAFFNQLKKQCILLCCQKVGFSTATEIYESLTNNEKFDEELNKELSEILASKDSNHHSIQENIPSYINSIMSEYLKNHVMHLTPFLMTAATEALKGDELCLKTPPAKKQKERSIEPHVIIQLAAKFNEGSTSASLSLDNSEKGIYLNKLKSIWNKNHMKYHNKLKKFEKDIFSYQKGSENGSSQTEDSISVKRPKRKHVTSLPVSPDKETESNSSMEAASVKRPKRRPAASLSLSPDKESEGNSSMEASSVERPRRKSTGFAVSPVEKTFPEVQTIKIREKLRPTAIKKHTHTAYRVLWTKEQEEEFYLAVQKMGLGNWAEIRDYISFHKTNINLKDKWRNFQQSGKIKTLAQKFGKV